MLRNPRNGKFYAVHENGSKLTKQEIIDTAGDFYFVSMFITSTNLEKLTEVYIKDMKLSAYDLQVILMNFQHTKGLITGHNNNLSK